MSDDAPVKMILHCPACGLQHIDEPCKGLMTSSGAEYFPPGAWTNPPHRSHLCHGCGHVWRPADVPTEGVCEIATRGKNDSQLARVVRDDALEAAAKITDGYIGCKAIASKIRALKGAVIPSQQPKPVLDLRNMRDARLYGDFSAVVTFMSCRAASAFVEALKGLKNG